MDRGPGNVRIYDSLDRPNADTPTRTRYVKDWRVDVIWACFAVFIILIFIGWHFLALSFLSSAIPFIVFLGKASLSIIYISLFFVIVGGAFFIILWLYNTAVKRGLINIMEHQAHIDRLPDMTQHYMRVMETQARNSLFRSAQNITYAPHIQKDKKTLTRLLEEPIIDDDDFLIGYEP